MSKLKKVSPKRALACLLALFALLTVFTALAESAETAEAPAATEQVAVAETAADAPAEEMTIDWIQEIINGGMTSAVLLLLSAAAIGFLVERLIRMRKKYLAPAYYADFFADAVATDSETVIIDFVRDVGRKKIDFKFGRAILVFRVEKERTRKVGRLRKVVRSVVAESKGAQHAPTHRLKRVDDVRLSAAVRAVNRGGAENLFAVARDVASLLGVGVEFVFRRFVRFGDGQVERRFVSKRFVVLEGKLKQHRLGPRIPILTVFPLF